MTQTPIAAGPQSSAPPCLRGEFFTGSHWKLEHPQPAGIGGERHVVKTECTLLASVEGKPVSVKARVVEEIGRDEDGKRIDVLFGALAMQEWGINVDTKNERLDLTHYPDEFVEF